MPHKSTLVNARIILVVFVVGIIVGVMLAPSMQTVRNNTSTLACISHVGNSSNNTENQTLQTTQIRRASTHILAVTSDTNEGVMGVAEVEIVPGSGRTLISTNPFVEPDTQQSVAIARGVAENFTDISFANYDVIASFELTLGNDSAQLVGGPSAGAALTTAMIAAILNTSVRTDVAMTGTIQADGTIGSVGGILEKAAAAGEAGIRTFFVPAGLGNLTYYEKIVTQEQRRGFTITRISYLPRTLSLNNYTMEQWNMTTVEAETIGDVVEVAIVDLPETILQ